MRKLRLIGIIALSFFAGSLVTLGTSLVLANGSDPNLIHGCVRNNGLLAGFVRIVGINVNCANNETPLNWNAEGLPGTGALVSNLHGATINKTDFSWRTLKNADFSGAGCNLSQNTFNHTDLTNANFTDCSFNSSVFTNVNFNIATFEHNDFTGVQISNSNLSGKNLTADNLDNIQISGSNLTNVNASNVTIGAFSITNSNLTNTNLSNLSLIGGTVNFNNSTVTGTNFTGFDSTHTNLSIFDGITGSNTNFTNANLTNAQFFGATLTTPIWSNTICPDGTNSNSHSNTCVGHGGGL